MAGIPWCAVLSKLGSQAEAHLESICRYELVKYGHNAAQILFQRAEMMVLETVAMVTQNCKTTIKI